MILATFKMVMPSHKKQEVIDFLRSFAEETRSLPGCISSRIYHSDEADNSLMIEELWDSQEALNRHLQSNSYHHMLIISELASERPEIKFQTIVGSAGIEMIERIRKNK